MKLWIVPAVILSVSFAFSGLTSGCAAVGAGAAGAAAGIYYSERGAESLVEAPVDRIYDQSQEVLREMGVKITRAEIEPDGKEREIAGTKGETEVTIKLSGESEAQTQVEVIAQKSAVTWDKEFARKVLSQIVEET